jgi:hypothetical protein
MSGKLEEEHPLGWRVPSKAAARVGRAAARTALIRRALDPMWTFPELAPAPNRMKILGAEGFSAAGDQGRINTPERDQSR